MRKVTKEEKRRGYILDIIIRYPKIYDHGGELYGEFKNKKPTQKDIVKIMLMECANNPSNEKKINLIVSKTLKSLEDDEVITRTPIKIPGVRGPAQYEITINNTIKALNQILYAYGGPFYTTTLPFLPELLVDLVKSDYYKSVMSKERFNELINLSELLFTEDDKELIFKIILVSPQALKTFFYEISRPKYKNHKNFLKRSIFEKDNGESLLKSFIICILMDFMQTAIQGGNRDVYPFNIELDFNAHIIGLDNHQTTVSKHMCIKNI